MSDPLEHLCDIAASLHARGYAFGSTGNLSIRTGDRVSITPTGESLRALRPEVLAEIDLNGKPLNNNKPSKEYPFHLAAYRAAGERAETTVFFESPYRIAKTLAACVTLMPDRPICVARELTKKFEEFRRGTAADLLAHYEAHPAKGEITLVISGAT